MTAASPAALRNADESVEPLGSLAWDRLLAGIASRFIEAPLAQYDDVVSDALRQIVLALDLDRSTLSYADTKLVELHPTHTWARPGCEPVPIGRTGLRYPWAAARLRKGLPLAYARLSDLPPEAAVDAANLAKLGLRAHVSLPIHVSRDFMAVLSFGMITREREWPEATLSRMRLLADIFGSLLARKRAQDRIDELVRLLVSVSAPLMAAPSALTDDELQRAMSAVGTFLHADRLRVYRTDVGAGRLAVVREWRCDGADAQAVHAIDEWPALGEVLAGRVVRVNSVAGDAAPVPHALLAMPLFANGTVVGALSVARIAATDEWRDELLPRLEVFGNMLSGAIARHDAEEAARRAMQEAADYRERLAHLARVDAVGAMSVAIAHEVNQPLAAIRNYALAGQRRLVGGRVDRARLQSLLEKIAGQAEAAAAVLDRVRATIVKRREPRREPVPVTTLFANALSLIELTARRQGVRVQTRLARDLPVVLGDEIQMQQVVMNLAHNAIEAMSGVPPERRVLNLAASRSDGGLVLIEVADTGPGVAAEDADRVFEPFYTTRGAGLGVGLAICRAIVEAHGGTLWHEPRPGGGSSFRFTVPAAGEGG